MNNIIYIDDKKQTPLIVATKYRMDDIVQKLIDHPQMTEQILNKEDSKYQTAYNVACKKHYPQIAKSLRDSGKITWMSALGLNSNSSLSNVNIVLPNTKPQN